MIAIYTPDDGQPDFIAILSKRLPVKGCRRAAPRPDTLSAPTPALPCDPLATARGSFRVLAKTPCQSARFARTHPNKAVPIGPILPLPIDPDRSPLQRGPWLLGDFLGRQGGDVRYNKYIIMMIDLLMYKLAQLIPSFVCP